MTTVLMLGSAPMATRAAHWPRAPFDRVLAINNAHAIRPDWDFHIHPFDFPPDRVPAPGPGQRIITETAFVPAQNAYGGFVFAGATMAFTAAYWALNALRPRVLAAFGCDMHYPATGPTHFYGQGTPDPLRPDITLRSLQAKSARLMIHAARQGCAMVNLSDGPSRLIFPRVDRARAAGPCRAGCHRRAVAAGRPTGQSPPPRASVICPQPRPAPSLPETRKGANHAGRHESGIIPVPDGTCRAGAGADRTRPGRDCGLSGPAPRRRRQ